MNDSHCLSISTRSGKMTIKLPMPSIVDDVVDLVTVVDDKVINFKDVMVNENEYKKTRVDDHEAKARKGKDKKVSKY